MTTTTIESQNNQEVEIPDEANRTEKLSPVAAKDDSQDSIMNRLSDGTEEIEIFSAESSLAGLDFIESAPSAVGAPLSLPAALCDDTLLKEIEAIPQQMGFKIGDVADLLGVKQYVLRYWETEFEILKPKKASNKQRIYTRKDVENAFLIRKLLHRDRFSIEGARHALRELKAHVKKEKDFNQVVNKIEGLQERLEDLVLDLRRVRQIFR